MVIMRPGNSASSSRAQWTAAMTSAAIALTSVALLIALRRHRAKSWALLSEDNFSSGAQSQQRRAASGGDGHDRLPPSPRKEEQGAEATTAAAIDAEHDSATTTVVEGAQSALPPGLRIGHGIWDYILAPLAAELICFICGMTVIYLAQRERVYTAVGVLVAVSLFRLKGAARMTNYAPLTDTTKLQLLRSLDRDTLYALLREDLPRWVKFPDVEKCDWLNQAIERLWPYVKVAAARSVKEALAADLEMVKPTLMMTELGFRGLDLGTAAPRINGIKSLTNLEEQVVVDVDLLIATQNTDVVLSFGNPMLHMSMNIELSDFVLRGTLRVVLKPLFPRWPTFGAVAVSFIEKPTVNFQLRTLHVNIMELPALSSTFHRAIRSALERRCVWPNKILLPFVDDLSKVELEMLAANRPLGMLVVRKLRLSGVNPLRALSRWSGAYSFHVQLRVGKESMSTDTVRGQSAFDFADRAFHLLVLDPKTQDLGLALKYKETLQTAKQIDNKWIRLDHLKPRVASAERVAFGRKGDGRAEFELCWYPFVGLMQRKAEEDKTSLPEDIVRMGAIFIKLVKCENLAPMDFNGTSDPYVVFRVGSRVKRSSIKRRTLNPIWDPAEHFELLVANDRHDALSVVVMDNDYLKTDDAIGNVAIPLAQVRRSGRLTNSWLLESTRGAVTLELEWRGF